MDNQKALSKAGLTRLGYSICILHFMLYLIMLGRLPKAALGTQYKNFAVPTAYFLLIILFLAMTVLSMVLLIGLMKKQVSYLYPWLIMSPVTVVMGIICVIIFSKYSLVFMTTMVLFFTALSWYPIFYILQKYRPNTKLPGQQQALGSREMCLLNRPAVCHSTQPQPAATASYRTETELNCMDAPPSYDEVIGSNSMHPRAHSSAKTVAVVGWNIPDK